MAGVRARLVDKDLSPKWDPPTLEQVSKDMVDEYFSPLSEFEPELKLPTTLREALKACFAGLGIFQCIKIMGGILSWAMLQIAGAGRGFSLAVGWPVLCGFNSELKKLKFLQEFGWGNATTHWWLIFVLLNEEETGTLSNYPDSLQCFPVAEFLIPILLVWEHCDRIEISL
ncbi:hypothetical protein ACLOJK_005491 [Asimina triloba]